jgi:hypothetical protein
LRRVVLMGEARIVRPSWWPYSHFQGKRSHNRQPECK